MSRRIWREDEGSRAEVGEPIGSRAPELWRDDELTEPIAAKPYELTSLRATNGSGSPAPKTRTPSVHRRSRARIWVWGIAALLIAAVAAEAGYELLTVRSALQSSRDSLRAAASDLGGGRTEAAREELTDAVDQAARAGDAAGRPLLDVGAALPVIGGDVETIRAIAVATKLAGEAGLAATSGIDALGANEESLASSIFEDGVVDFDSLRAAGPFLSRAADLLSRGEEVLSAAPPPVTDAVQEPLDAASERIGSARATAERGVALMDALPGLLGADSSKRYLLVFEALGEARATGGLAGLYGVLAADGGHLRLESIKSYTDLQNEAAFPAPVSAPGWFEKNYGPQYATRQWQQVNLSPSFPEVSRVFLSMYRQSTGERLDGVIAMDGVALQELMPATGPIQVKDREIEAEDVLSLLSEDIYLDFESEEQQNAFLERFVRGFWNKVESGEFDPPTLGAAFGEAVRTYHVKVFSEDGDTQSLMSDLGAAGALEGKERFTQMVFNNNYSGNKVDVFLRESVFTRVDLSEAGEANVRTRVRLRNDAPSGPPSLLLGLPGEDPGLNRMILNFLLPPDGDVGSLKVDGKESSAVEYLEDERPVVWSLLEIEPGDKASVQLAYRVPRAVVPISSEEAVFSATFVPQPSINPSAFRVAIEAPPGFGFLDEDGETSTLYTWNGRLETARTFNLTLVALGE